jgi:hypothetical protein
MVHQKHLFRFSKKIKQKLFEKASAVMRNFECIKHFKKVFFIGYQFFLFIYKIYY